MICGGAEATITPTGMAGFCSMRAMSTRNDEPERASRPFDRERDGFVMGEGSGVLILESLEHAQKRGATNLCGSHRLRHERRRASHHRSGSRWRRPLHEQGDSGRGIRPEEVDYINAHGTSTADRAIFPRQTRSRRLSANMPTGWPSVPRSR